MPGLAAGHTVMGPSWSTNSRVTLAMMSMANAGRSVAAGVVTGASCVVNEVFETLQTGSVGQVES